jgi:hypothetical protein
VRVGDLPGQSLRAWSEILTEKPRHYRGYDGLALHQQPEEESSVLVTLRARQVNDSGVHQLTPTGEVSGEWGQFEVVEFDSDFYPLSATRQASPTGRQWKGWLRVVNAEGAPAFWFFTRD